VPKGLLAAGEDHLACARREFKEETGVEISTSTDAHDLGIFRQPSGKQLHVWAIEGNFDPTKLKSNLFEIEWPPKSGRKERFPEVDRAGWFDEEQAGIKITPGQRPILASFYAQMG